MKGAHQQVHRGHAAQGEAAVHAKHPERAATEEVGEDSHRREDWRGRQREARREKVKRRLHVFALTLAARNAASPASETSTHFGSTASASAA